MNYILAFDLFSDCYVYVSIAYIFFSVTTQLILSFLSLIDESNLNSKTETDGADFYEQVKELLDFSSEDFAFEPLTQPLFERMTIRELRSFIREHNLQEYINSCLGKTVSNARKHELVKVLS